MGFKTGSLEVAPVMEGSSGDVTVPKRQSEQRQDGSSIQRNLRLDWLY